MKSIILYFKMLFKSKSISKSKAIEQIWKGVFTKRNDFNLINKYYNAKNATKSTTENCNETTWVDLDMDNIFNLIDRNTCPIGKQYLYNQIHTNESYSNKPGIDQYLFFVNEHDFRNKIQRVLIELNHNSLYHVVQLLFNPLPVKNAAIYLLSLASIALFGFIAATFYSSVYIFPVLGMLVANFIIHYYFSHKVIGYIPDLNAMSRLLRASTNLCKIKTNSIPQILSLQPHLKIIRQVKSKIGWLVIDTSRLDEITGAIIEYFNYFFLLNIISFYRASRTITENRTALISVYEAIGALDSSISIASYLNSVKQYTKPTFNSSGIIKFENLYHPLLDNPVSNSLTLNNKSCLITGSNMAGKTTFIKTIGVNLILGRSLGFCLGKSAEFPNYIVRSSIKMADNINEAKSYYYREIEAILDFINTATEHRKHLFLIDEIFRGTNTLERISGAAAVLDYLSNTGISFVTTHDLELQVLLNEKYEMYHFSEQIEDGRHFFDYKLKSGPCDSKNAIELLKIKGYPDKIVNDALKISDSLQKSRILM